MKLHHIAIAVRDIRKDGLQYTESLGLPPPGPIQEDPAQKVRVAFSSINDEVAIEFVEPTCEGSPVSALVARGGGIYHPCYEVHALDKALALLTAQGGMVVSPPAPAPAFNGRRIAFAMTTGGHLVEFLEDK